jgi:hypothetical protein
MYSKKYIYKTETIDKFPIETLSGHMGLCVCRRVARNHPRGPMWYNEDMTPTQCAKCRSLYFDVGEGCTCCSGSCSCHRAMREERAARIAKARRRLTDNPFGTCSKGHPLRHSTVYIAPSTGQIQCRSCMDIASAAWAQRNAAKRRKSKTAYHRKWRANQKAQNDAEAQWAADNP